MLDTPTHTESLRNKRVQVTLADGSKKFGVLKGLTADKMWLDETALFRPDVADIEEATFTCSVCGRAVNKLFDGMCANDYRDAASRKPTPQEPCGVCGNPGIRQPGTDIFLCTIHHAEAGNKLRIGIGQADVLAECATEDVTSPKHEWGQVRGARFRCIRCRRAEKWDAELLAELQKDRGL